MPARSSDRHFSDTVREWQQKVWYTELRNMQACGVKEKKSNLIIYQAKNTQAWHSINTEK